jgi:TRAP-type C4-dicarboxylate transport system permease small subunit
MTEERAAGAGPQPRHDVSPSHTQTPDPKRPNNPIARVLFAIDRGISYVEAFMLSAGVLLMATNSIANVVGRQVFGQSIYFAEEVNRFLIVLITFAGIGYAARRARHIRMTANYDALGDRAKKAMTIVISLVTAAFMFGLAYYAVIYISGVGNVTPALQIPKYLTLLWIPVGLAVTGIQYLLAAVKNMVAPGIWLSVEEEEGYIDPTETSAV